MRRSLWSTSLGMVLAAAVLVAQGPAPATRVSPDTSRASSDTVVTGELVIEPATLINLGFEWFIQGDANRNASVDVAFRKKGAMPWRPALPLLRLQGERIYAESRVDLVAPNMFAGSVLDLEPGTSYEVRLTMTDPDGVQGERRRVVIGEHPARATAVCRRARVSCLPARLHRPEDRAGLRRADVRIQLLVRGHRLGDVGPAAGEAGRHDPRARRCLSVQPLRVHQRRQGQSHRAARRHVLPDRRRHRGHADCDQGGR